MLFEVHNPTTSRTSHCGVLEFVAEEGMIYMPYWVFISLLTILLYCVCCLGSVPYYVNVWALWSLVRGSSYSVGGFSELFEGPIYGMLTSANIRFYEILFR